MKAWVVESTNKLQNKEKELEIAQAESAIHQARAMRYESQVTELQAKFQESELLQ